MHSSKPIVLQSIVNFNIGKLKIIVLEAGGSPEQMQNVTKETKYITNAWNNFTEGGR